MPAYALFDNVEVTDAAGLEEYKEKVAPVVERFGGRYVVLGGELETLEGEPQLRFPVLIEFPDAAAAKAWHDSDEYRPLLELRKRSVKVNATILPGLGTT